MINDQLHKVKLYDELKYTEYNQSENQRAAYTHYLSNNKLLHLKDEAFSFADVFSESFNDNINDTAIQYKINNFNGYKTNDLFLPRVTTDFSFIDLFAGIGGFRIAMQELGGECLFSSEWDKAAKATYELNYGEYPFDDITKNETKKFIPKNFDLLCAGFPCQAFSVAGYQKGFEDTRGTLFFDIQNILEVHRPKAFFLENVKNLANHDKGRTLKIMLNILENKLGYKVYYKVLNTMEYANIPQNRERIFIVGFDPIRVKNFSFFSFPDKIELTKNIRDLINNTKQDNKYYYQKDHIYFPKLKESINSKDTIYQWRRVYVRENKSNVCPTLTANMGAGGHNVPIILDDFGIRKLTPRECLRFQGYPENFNLPYLSDSKLYMQAGNSVTVPLIKRIAQQIKKIIL